MALPKVVVVIGNLREKAVAAAAGDGCRAYVLPEPLDFSYLKDKRPDLIVIFDRAVPGTAMNYARFLRGRITAPEALLVAAYPNNHRPRSHELLQAGIALAVPESEAAGNFSALYSRAAASMEAARAEQMPLMETANQKPLAFAVPAAASAAPVTLRQGPSVAPRESNHVPDAVVAPAPGQMACVRCNRWRPAPTDKYCAWCGERLVILRCDPTALDFRTDRKDANRCGLTLHNDGINTLYASVEVLGKPEVKRRFTILPERTHGAVEVQAGAAEPLTIVFENAGLDPGGDYSTALEICTNLDEKIHVPLRVERPPSARLIVPPGQKIVYGDPATLSLFVRNQGGGVLELAGLKLQEPGTPASVILSDSVRAGPETLVNIPLDVKGLKPGTYTARGQVEFANHDALSFMVQFAFSRPARLKPETEELALQVYNIGRRRHRGVKLLNLGAEALTLKGQPTSEVAWLNSYCRNTTIQKEDEGYLDVFVDARKLQPGRTYKGEVRLESNGHEKVTILKVRLTVSQLDPLEEPIGIDFGTSVSCAATVVDGVPRLIDLNPLSEAESIEGSSLPSVVFFEQNLFPIVGSVAKDKAKLDRNSAVSSVKRLLGERKKLKIRDQELTPVEVTTEVFREILSTIESSTVADGSPANALLTVPADISDEQIKGVLEAAKAAGLDIEPGATDDYLLDEPSAAALYYFWKSGERLQQEGSELLFIYDFGAGTLDCSLVEIRSRGKNTNIKVLGTAGNRRLGGDDIDMALAQFAARSLARTVPEFDPRPVLASEAELNKLAMQDRIVYQQYQAVRADFKDAAERLKIELSQKESAEGSFPLGSNKFQQLTVRRQDFEALLDPFIEKSNLVVEGCCHLAGIGDPRNVLTLLHSGRGSQVPRIKESVRAFFPSATDRSDSIEAKECVALGAAWWASIKNLPRDDTITFERVGKVLPNTICYRQGEGFRANFLSIFEAGKTFPAEKQLTITGQEGRRMRLEIFEKRFGMDRVRPRRRSFVKLPASATGKYDCVFRLNANRILEVIVGDQKLEIEPADDDDTAPGGAA